MKKSDLKFGNMVEFHNGFKGVIENFLFPLSYPQNKLDDLGIKMALIRDITTPLNGKIYYSLDNYSDELICLYNSEFTIDKVYEDCSTAHLIYERKYDEPKKRKKVKFLYYFGPLKEPKIEDYEIYEGEEK